MSEKDEIIELPEAIRRIEMFFNENREPVDSASEAVFKNVTIYDEDGKKVDSYSVDIIDGVDQEYVEEAEEFQKKSIVDNPPYGKDIVNNERKYGTISGYKLYPYGRVTEEFKEDEHPRADDGKFTSGGDTSGKINDFKNKLRDKIQSNDEVKAIQKEVDEEITGKIWKTINELGIKDKIKEVEMQGSFAKGTDLPTSGSDLDIFVVFKTNIPENERQELGIKIGMKALAGKNPQIKDATSKYAEAYFDYKGQKMEVQIVPTRHLTLEQIKNKELDGKPIKIGMERTPHQTKFMKQALKGKEGEVRMLKQFMKDTGLYDSSMKSQGFSGYSAEVLIHNFDTFEETLNFFANFEKGKVIGGDKGNSNNLFSLIDPIDPNRDLISAFSPVKIGRTIKTAQYFLEHGEPPKRSEPVEMNSVSVSFNTTQTNEDTLAGQIRKTQKSIISYLKKNGFDVPTKLEKIGELEIDVDRISVERTGDKITLNFGMEKTDLKSDEYPVIMHPKADLSKVKARIEKSPDGTTTAWYKRKFTNAKDLVKDIMKNPSGNIKDTGVIDDIKQGVDVITKQSKFENMI